MKSLIFSLIHDEEGQDLIEYSLLLAFVALGTGAVFAGVGKNVSGVWKSANTTLATAQAMAAS
jgi:Flp pilus assembly pilin Flp